MALIDYDQNTASLEPLRWVIGRREVPLTVRGLNPDLNPITKKRLTFVSLFFRFKFQERKSHIVQHDSYYPHEPEAFY